MQTLVAGRERPSPPRGFGAAALRSGFPASFPRRPAAIAAEPEVVFSGQIDVDVVAWACAARSSATATVQLLLPVRRPQYSSFSFCGSSVLLRRSRGSCGSCSCGLAAEACSVSAAQRVGGTSTVVIASRSQSGIVVTRTAMRYTRLPPRRAPTPVSGAAFLVFVQTAVDANTCAPERCASSLALSAALVV